MSLKILTLPLNQVTLIESIMAASPKPKNSDLEFWDK